MKQFFITGTDTGVGKTYAAAVLMRALNAYYWKPIQSGVAFDSPDCETVKALTELPPEHFLPTVYNLKASLAPDQAARLENITITLDHCQLPDVTKNLIVEGAGGVYVPLNPQSTMLDLMKQLGLPIIIVARGTLGTINHTLLTLFALRQAHLTVKGIIFCGELNPENQQSIEERGNVKTLLHIPFMQDFKTWLQENHTHVREKLR